MENKTVPKKHTKRKRYLIGASIIIVLLIIVASVTFAWWYSNQFIESRHGKPEYKETIERVALLPSGQTVISFGYSADAARPGQYGLYWPGGSALIGKIVAQDGDHIDRILLKGMHPKAGTKVGMNWTYGSDPKAALGCNFYDINIQTELGPAPAWYIPADSVMGRTHDTWAITVHGSNADRHSSLPVALSLHRSGLPIIDMTYRNDIGAPRSKDGLLHLGLDEWRDLEAGVRTCISMGARRVVLFGGSMGGGIVLQFLSRSSYANRVSAIILDAPMLSVPNMLDYLSAKHHVPSVITGLTREILNHRLGTDVGQVDFLRFPPRVKPRMLLLQGMSDQVMPLKTARQFVKKAGQGGWQTQYAEFPKAGHSEAWTTDAVRYDSLVCTFLKQEKK